MKVFTLSLRLRSAIASASNNISHAASICQIAPKIESWNLVSITIWIGIYKSKSTFKSKRNQNFKSRQLTVIRNLLSLLQTATAPSIACIYLNNIVTLRSTFKNPWKAKTSTTKTRKLLRTIN